MRTLLFLLISNVCIAQTAISLTTRVQRIGINHKDKTDELAKVKILIDSPFIGIMTPYDTLVLKKKEFSFFWLFEDHYHDKQLYDVSVVSDKDGFIIFITPYKPYNRKLHSLIISGI